MSADRPAASTAPPAEPPASSRRDPALDGLRGLAILLIFLFHYGGGLKSSHPLLRAFGLLSQAGWSGLILFFVLSGFLITGLLWDSLGSPHWLGHFYARRALRILPLYFAALLLAALYALLHGASIGQASPLLLFVAFLQNLPGLAAHTTLPGPSLPLYHLWSLAVEEQFYLLWPALLLLAHRSRSSARTPVARALRLTLCIFLLSELFRLLISSLLPRLVALPAGLFDESLFTHAGSLALGAALALLLRAPHPVLLGRSSARSLAWLALLLGVALYLVAGLLGHTLLLTTQPQMALGLPALSLAAAALTGLALQPGAPRRLLALAPLAGLGRISYGFYVLHILCQPLFDLLGRHLAHAASGSRYQAWRMLVAFPLSLLFAWISFHLLERPCLRLQRRFPLPSALPKLSSARSPASHPGLTP